METIKNTAANAATAVTNIVWGTNGNTTQEPQSGVQGDTSKGEPFDGGNMETQKTESGPTGAVGGASQNKDSSVGKGDSTKGQNDVREPGNPQTESKNADAAKDVDDSGEGPNSVKVDGPGPKPIEQVAKEHGGDAGNLGKDGKDTKTDGTSETKNPVQVEDDDGPQKESHGEGTGELYVKSSGLKADGGDFDASKPGAGKEADRLLEKKGIHHSGQDIEKTPSADTGTANKGKTPSPEREEKKKKSLGQKLKEKLHRKSDSGS